MGGGRGGPAPAAQAVALQPADYQAFEQLLKSVQAAWSRQDLSALRTLASPEMVSYFAEQLAEREPRRAQCRLRCRVAARRSIGGLG